MSRQVFELARRRQAISFVAALTWSCAQAAELGWPEAVGRLAGERSKAEICAGVLKKRGTEAQISRGLLAYSTAKADNDAVISGLIVALALDNDPASLSDIERTQEREAFELAEFCKQVAALLGSETGEKGVLTDIVKAAIEPLMMALSEAVRSIYNNHRNDNLLVKKTIEARLEAAKWPNFADIKPQD